MNRFDDCLRPEFTERILKRLTEGRSLNIYGPEGAGRRRLLEDIRRHAPDQVKTALVGMKSYKESYAGLIKALCKDLCLDGEQPANISDLMERFESGREKDEKAFILFDGFHGLLDNPQIDKAYNVHFFDALNFIKSIRCLSLLCVTIKPHDASVVHAGGECHHSWLELEKYEIPSLKWKEIDAEISRRGISLTKDDQRMMIERILNHERPYQVLEMFIQKIENREDEALDTRLKFNQWLKEFQRLHRLGIKKAYKFRKKINLWEKVLGIDILNKLSLLFSNTGKFIFDWLTKKSGDQ